MALVLNDFTSNGYTLTNSGGTESTSLPFASNNNSSISFDGASTYATNANAIIDPRSDYTVEFWVKLNAEISSGGWEFFHLENNTAKHALYGNYNYNGGTRQFTFQQDRWNLIGSYTNYVVTLGTSNWNHIAVVKSGTSLQMYFNGSAVGTQTGSIDNATGNTTTNNVVYLGRGVNVGTSTGVNYANAIIDDIRIWNTARSGSNINTYKSTRLVGNEANLQAYYPFDNGSSSKALFFSQL